MTGDGAKTGGVLVLPAAAGAGHVRYGDALAAAVVSVVKQLLPGKA